MKVIETFFIFRYDEQDKLSYLTKQKTWSDDINDVELMSEHQASHTCTEYEAPGYTTACGSCTVKIV